MPKTSINYQNTIIYKIVCNDLNIKYCYVGHTTSFAKRKSLHKRCVENENNAGHKFKVYQTIKENGGWDNWTMVEIEKCPCETFEEARKRERHWYDELNASLNERKPYLSPIEKENNHKVHYENNKDLILLRTKEWKLNNKEKVQESHSNYNLKNREQINQRNREYKHLHKKEEYEYHKAYKEQNKERLRERDRLYGIRRKEQKKMEMEDKNVLKLSL
jgi:hypothetical protein